MDEYVIVDHDGVEAETDDAVAFDVDGRIVWVPNSVICWWDTREASVPRWYLDKVDWI